MRAVGEVRHSPPRSEAPAALESGNVPVCNLQVGDLVEPAGAFVVATSPLRMSSSKRSARAISRAIRGTRAVPTETGIKPGAGIGPLPFSGPRRDPKRKGGIFQSEPSEKPQVHQPGGVGVLHGKLRQRFLHGRRQLPGGSSLARIVREGRPGAGSSPKRLISRGLR